MKQTRLIILMGSLITSNFFIIHDKDISKDENILNTLDNIYYIS
jgi:hypothetical protein